MSSGTDVFMDVPTIQQYSQNFEQIAGVLQTVSSTMEALMTTLKVTAFIGLVGGAAVERFLAQLKPVIDTLAEKCQELSGDLKASATAYQNGDAAGSTRFH